MAMTYVTGYNGTVRTREQLLAWSHWQNLDEELQRRVLALLDASIVAGRPVGVGSIFRSFTGQETLFYSRHQEVASGGCCSYNGKRYALRPGMAHAAPPGRSYHEATTSKQKALALDFVGDLRFLKENAAKYGLVEFSNVNNEPWHGQPADVPSSRSRYVLAIHDPLKPFTLPGLPTPAPTKIWAPTPTLRQDARATQDKDQVRSFQLKCNFWGWRDRMNKTLLVDGDYGNKSAEACVAMQRTLGLYVDGDYGPKSQAGLQAFLDYMSSLAAK